jgi:MoxR-like ATPase
MPSEAHTPLSENKYYVLYVEDEQSVFKEAVQKVVSNCLLRYGFSESNIEWEFAKNQAMANAAIATMAKRSQPGRGFDAAICDLQIPPASATYPDWQLGFEVAKEIRQQKWLTAVIGLSKFAALPELLEYKKANDVPGAGGLKIGIFDEFLDKADFASRDGELTSDRALQAKLQRWLIPTFHFVAKARQIWTPPGHFSRSTWGILRSLLQIVNQDVAGWPLPRILFLGKSGSGKSFFAGVYYRLLQEMDQLLDKQKAQIPPVPQRQTRAGLFVVNCATLVADGEGGRIRLFGFKQRGSSLPAVPGIFERATRYTQIVDKDGFAPDNAEPNYAAGGVVFLDEFATLDSQLQAAVLNALEDGVVQRQDGTVVRIGCHVLFATNANRDELREGIRGDLLDRIPYVLNVPSLRHRKDEISPLIRAFAEDRLWQLNAKQGTRPKVSILPSATQIIERAIDRGILTSVRQLQTIAIVRNGETSITDGNLSWLLQKADLLGVRLDAEDASKTNVRQKADFLSLPSELQTENIPELTKYAIEFVYGLCSNNWKDVSREDKEKARRVYFVITLMPSGATIPFNSNVPSGETLTGQTATAFRKTRSRLAKEVGVNTQHDDAVIAYLLDRRPEGEPQAKAASVGLL